MLVQWPYSPDWCRIKHCNAYFFLYHKSTPPAKKDVLTVLNTPHFSNINHMQIAEGA